MTNHQTAQDQTSALACPSGEQIELEFGDQRVVVVQVGAGLRTYAAAGRDLIDGYGAEEICTSGRGQVLMPWPNRLEDGAYDFEGRHHQLPIDEVSAHNAIHGLVRWQPWTVAEQHTARVVMQHALHPQPGYPFSLLLTIEYELGPDGLAVRTQAVNTGVDSCPFGSGAHPYLRLGEGLIDDLTLSVPASSYLRANTRGIPVATEHVEGWPFDFRRPRTIGRRRMDHAFCDLERDGDGRARVRLSDPRSGEGVTLWLDETFPYVMLFTGDGLPDVARRSLAVEPMTCAPNAFRTGDGLVVLAPGESLSSEWGISPE